jgi:hypothetical protein
MMGPVERTGRTAANGSVHFAGLRAGVYRVRFEHEGFIALEREVNVRGTQAEEIGATLSAAAPPPPAPEPAPAPPAVEHAPLPAAVFDITAYLEQDYLKSGPNRVKSIACSATDSVSLVQTTSSYASAAGDRQLVLVTIAGKGQVTVGGKTTPVDAKSGTTVTVPQGTALEASRDGKSTLVFVLVQLGSGCSAGDTK